MAPSALTTRPGRQRAFTLIELLVSIAISVLLLSILAFVFRISTNATRNANSRVSLTERLRSLNIRLRQEIGGMLPVVRASNSLTYQISDDTLIFAAATIENSKPVSIDVKYMYIKGKSDAPEKGMLIRYRDKTGPYDSTDPTKNNPNYKLGDDEWEPAQESDILLSNVRYVQFSVINPPPPATTSTTEFYPRELPSGVRLTIVFGPEVGDTDMLEPITMDFPVNRGF
jgi:prepilin-type N-terminal cleavage/methylation domain-containing protein